MPLTSRHKALILALTCIVQFMVVLDIAIVNVALPAIQQDLGLSESSLQWLVITYGLFLGGFLLLGGRLADLVGRRRVLISGLMVFTGSSLVAGLGGSSALIIAARGAQGLGAALMAPAALSILAVTFTRADERQRALGIFGAVGGTSASIGVITSGVLVDGPGWRWVFFLNVPVGVALLAGAVLLLGRDEPRARRGHFDAVGSLSVTAALVALIYAVNRATDHGWVSVSTLAFGAASVALFTLFLWNERRAAEPLIPAAIVRNRPLVTANTMAFFLFGGFFSFIFLGSLLMQQVLGFSATRTGVSWLATSVVAFVVAGATGAGLMARFGARRLLTIAMVCLTGSGILLTRVPPHASYIRDLLPAFLLAGVAIGLGAVSVQVGALTGVSNSAAGLASGLVETMREIGGAVGVAIVATVIVGSSATGARTGGTGHLLNGFHSASIVIAVFAVLGALVAAIGFQRASAGAGEVAVLEPALDAAAA
jgi:EmrB/QacA subfamily drug resistance transporter